MYHISAQVWWCSCFDNRHNRMPMDCKPILILYPHHSLAKVVHGHNSFYEQLEGVTKINVIHKADNRKVFRGFYVATGAAGTSVYSNDDLFHFLSDQEGCADITEVQHLHTEVANKVVIQGADDGAWLW